jgi:hypothetical protein
VKNKVTQLVLKKIRLVAKISPQQMLKNVGGGTPKTSLVTMDVSGCRTKAGVIVKVSVA